MKAYRRHRCTSMHRTFNKLMRCMLPRAAWVHGEGQFALIAWCRVTTVTLWSTAEEAHKAREFIDGAGCGGRCTGRHEVVKLEFTQ